ncbi:MAG: leucyl/phenylalanyl-tRNA--protein transferase [Proteobacteria bacterium]|nr:leucyl/phenylalanyl-tRNA--protein transferase [Pseudomonadota bacterium]
MPRRSLAAAASPELRAHGFGEPKLVGAEGIVAVGGAFTVERLLVAYRHGIFPWDGDPVRWCCPDPRSIFWKVRLPRRLGKSVRRHQLRVTFDEDFEGVIRACAEHHRSEKGTWITPQFIAGYVALHAAGHAHSVEVWQGDRLVGGLYGVQLNGMFAGESMFHRVTDASKVAFAALVHQLQAVGTVLFDCQAINLHTHRLGAALVARADYLRMLAFALGVATRGDGERWPRSGHCDLRLSGLKDAVPDQPGDAAGTRRAGLQPGRLEAPAAPERRLRFWSLETESGDAGAE